MALSFRILLQLRLREVAARDKEGNYLLKPDTLPKGVRIEKAAERRLAVQKSLKKVTREVVDATFSRILRST